jgi:hypothetical protein
MRKVPYRARELSAASLDLSTCYYTPPTPLLLIRDRGRVLCTCDHRGDLLLPTSLIPLSNTAIMSTKGFVPFLVAMMLLTGVCNTLLTKYQV